MAAPTSKVISVKTLDSRGPSTHGTLQNCAVFGDGVSGHAFQLDGQNDHVTVPDNPIWAFGADPFSIALWANFDVVKPGPQGQLPSVFIGHDAGPGPINRWVFFFGDNNTLNFHINGVPGSLFLASTSPFTPTVGDWHHFAVTRDSGNYTFYADGISLGTVEDPLNRLIPNASALLTIGQAEGLGYFDGHLDRIQIYDFALSATQAAKLASPVPLPAALPLLAGGPGLFGLARWAKKAQNCDRLID